MTDAGRSREEILAKLAESRAEIRRLLVPPSRSAPGISDVGGDGDGGNFPRSRTMRALMTGRGIGTVSAVVGGLLMARPALALRLLRMVPTGAVARILMVKAITAFRSRAE
jgi:hypothetical protein